MENFLSQLSKMNNLEELEGWKEKIKSQVIQTHISWQNRMTLYKQVNLINEKIQQLEHDLESIE